LHVKTAATSSPTTIKITIPGLPYTPLRSNYHKGNFWFTRAKWSAIAREEAFALGKEQHLKEPITSCKIEEVFTVPTKRRIDIEGLMGACKPWIDGLVDAGIIIDDSWKYVKRLSGRIVYEKGVEQTEIIITPID